MGGRPAGGPGSGGGGLLVQGQGGLLLTESWKETPDRWLSLTVQWAGESEEESERLLGAELFPELLMEMGGRGVQEGPEGFTTYLPPPGDLETFLEGVRARLSIMVGGRASVKWGWQPHEDWEVLWRRGLGPRRITPRIVVAPSWDLPPKDPEEILIILDPGMAFGTAEHATTRGCLRLLDGRVQKGDRIADIGSGSGILSIAAAHLGASEVVGVELDPMSCQAARENLEANGVGDRVRILTQEIRETSLLPGAPFHGIVANIQRTILTPLLPSFRDSLRPGGWLILSGILLEEQSQILDAAGKNAFSLEESDSEGEWWSGAFLQLT